MTTLADLEARVAALEQSLEQSSNDIDETLQPNPFFTINPATGVISGLFPGGVEMDEQTAATYSAANALGWLGNDGSGNIYEFIIGAIITGIHSLAATSQADATDFAVLSEQSVKSGAAGSAQVIANVRDSTGTLLISKFIDSLGRSSFLQGGFSTPPLVTQPARVVNTVYTPNVNHPVLVIAAVGLASTGALTTSIMDMYVSGTKVATVNCGDIGASTGNGGILVGLVSAGGTYEFIPTIPAGGTVTLSYVTEYQL